MKCLYFLAKSSVCQMTALFSATYVHIPQGDSRLVSQYVSNVIEK